MSGSGKEGLEMFRDFFHVWCDKKLSGIDSRDLNDPTSLGSKLMPDMSGICYRRSDIPP
ncbi:hypothetical protein YTPLAS72_09530 [Nitrospira sp.]|nr:hypothetical protein YTPLAS72_09530 [Nitrospira sp.]